MKRSLAAVFALSFALPAVSASAQDADTDLLGAGDEPAPTEIFVDLKDDTTEEDEREIEAKLGGIDLRLSSMQAKTEKFFVAAVSEFDLDRLIAAIKDDPRVEHAEPNFVYEALGIPNPPNDPLFDKQWSFRMIDVGSAWESVEGSGVVVAVIDTGVAYEDHERFRKVEDLKGTEFAKGYDFVNDDDHANDDHGHGTHVAGTIAQTTHNGVGVAGLAPKASIMPLKVLNRAGMGTVADIADAIRYAADEGADVINMSLGGGGHSQTLASAVAYARKKGVVVVCAAGNGGRGRVEYPAAYPGAFAVSAVGPDKKLAFYSSWGKELAISAPGGDKQKGGDLGAVLQNTITPNAVGTTNVYLAFQGTSMATPHVAGAAALIISAGVNEASAVEAILKETAEDVGQTGWDERYGAGVLNAGRAVDKAKQESSGLRHLLAGLGSLVVFAFLGRRSKAKIGFLGLVGTVLGASGLFFLGRLGLGSIPGLGLFTTAMPAWDGEIFGAHYRYTALWASFIPLAVASVALLSAKKFRGFLIGLAIGWAAHLFVAACTMQADVRFIPGVAGILDRGWLIVSALVLFVLAYLIRAVHARK